MSFNQILATVHISRGDDDVIAFEYSKKLQIRGGVWVNYFRFIVVLVVGMAAKTVVSKCEGVDSL